VGVLGLIRAMGSGALLLQTQTIERIPRRHLYHP